MEMQIMNSFEIRFDGGALELSVYGYENAAAITISDANWLKCRLDYRLEGLSGSSKLSVTTTEITIFRDEVKAMLQQLRGHAVFCNDEDDIRIELKFVSMGGVEVFGKIVKNGTMRYQVDFTSTSDQSRIAQCHKELVMVTDKFHRILRGES